MFNELFSCVAPILPCYANVCRQISGDRLYCPNKREGNSLVLAALRPDVLKTIPPLIDIDYFVSCYHGDRRDDRSRLRRAPDGHQDVAGRGDISPSLPCLIED